MRLDFFVNLKGQTSTLILLLDIKLYMRDLLSVNVREPYLCDIDHTVMQMM